VQRDAPEAQPAWAPGAQLSVPGIPSLLGIDTLAGLSMRKTRSRGGEPTLPFSATGAAASLPPSFLSNHHPLGGGGGISAQFPSEPLAGLPMRKTRSRGAADAPVYPVSQTWPTTAATTAAMMLPPPLPLQPTLSEWGNLGLDTGLGGDAGQGLPMRRTRSTLGAAPAAAVAAVAPPPRIPALPMMPSLSDAALAIGLDMSEAADLLQDGSPGHSSSPSRRARPRGGQRSPVAAAAMAASWGAGARLPASSYAAASTGTAGTSSQPPPALLPALPLMPSSSSFGLQGSPMRRTRSRGLPPALPMTHSVSELVASFISSNPAGEGEPGLGEGDVLDGW